jgi:hypothetical protein
VAYRQGLPWNYAAYMGTGAALVLPRRPVPSAEAEARAAFERTAQQLLARLGEYADVDAAADATALDFVLHRLPPTDAPPAPPTSTATLTGTRAGYSMCVCMCVCMSVCICAFVREC